MRFFFVIFITLFGASSALALDDLQDYTPPQMFNTPQQNIQIEEFEIQEVAAKSPEHHKMRHSITKTMPKIFEPEEKQSFVPPLPPRRPKKLHASKAYLKKLRQQSQSLALQPYDDLGGQLSAPSVEDILGHIDPQN